MKSPKKDIQKKTARIVGTKKSHDPSIHTSNHSSSTLNNVSVNIELSQQLNEPFASISQVDDTALEKYRNGQSNNSQPHSKSNIDNSYDDNERNTESHNGNGANTIKTDDVDNPRSSKPTSLLQTIMDKQIKDNNIMHPSFDKRKKPLDPNRSLNEIPSPPSRYKDELNKLLAVGKSLPSNSVNGLSQEAVEVQSNKNTKFDNASMWSLIATPELASHLELLQLGGLIHLPEKFFKPIKVVKDTCQKSLNCKSNNQSDVASNLNQNDNRNNGNNSDLIKEHPDLLTPLTEMKLLDLSDIYQIYATHPNLTRYGFKNDVNPLSCKKDTNNQVLSHKQSSNKRLSAKGTLPEIPEILNDMFSPNWELILYPERFDNGIDSLATDILACSVAVHTLKQCPIRRTVNRTITIEQICQHMRSYVLHQCKLAPQFEQQYRQIRLFVGHVIVALDYLGFNVVHATQHKKNLQKNSGQPVYTNISSRATLLTRYPDISRYYINGWS